MERTSCTSLLLYLKLLFPETFTPISHSIQRSVPNKKDFQKIPILKDTKHLVSRKAVFHENDLMMFLNILLQKI